MMCAAFTDPADPLQVTQFEADIRVVEQLLDFKLDGGNAYAFDNILWYFAAKHTKIDSYAKRGKKGILIGIGDEICGRSKNILKSSQIEALFSDKDVSDVSFDEALSMAREQFEVVHIVVGKDKRFADGPDQRFGPSYGGWKEALPGRVVKLREKDISLLADVIVASIQMLSGVSRDSALAQVPVENREIVREAIEDFGDSEFVSETGDTSNKYDNSFAENTFQKDNNTLAEETSQKDNNTIVQDTSQKDNNSFTEDIPQKYNNSLANEITQKRGIFDGLFHNRK